MSRVIHRDATRQLPMLILFLIGVGLTVGLYFVKARALSAKAEVEAMRVQIETERTGLAVLRAELAYLENPERISKLAEKELGMKPVKTGTVIQIKDLDKVLPIENIRAETSRD